MLLPKDSEVICISKISKFSGTVVIITTQLHSTNPDGKEFWRWSRLQITLNAFRRSALPQKQFIIKLLVLEFGSRALSIAQKKKRSFKLAFLAHLNEQFVIIFETTHCKYTKNQEADAVCFLKTSRALLSTIPCIIAGGG